MSLLANFPHECTIQKRTVTKGDFGGTIPSVSIEQTKVACWEQSATHGEILEYEKRGMNVSKKIYFLTDPSISEGYEILITKRNGITVSSTIAYDVLSEALPDASAGLAVVYKAMVNQNLGSLQ